MVWHNRMKMDGLYLAVFFSNDLVYQIEAIIETSGGLSYIDLDSMNDEINRILLGAIDYKYSIDALKGLLSNEC